MRIRRGRATIAIATLSGLLVMAIGGCTGSSGDKDNGRPTPTATGSEATASGQAGGDAAIAKRNAADLPGGFPDACLLVTTTDVLNAVHLTQEPQGDTIGQGSAAISICSYTDGAGTTILIRTGMAERYSSEVKAGNTITNADDTALTGIGDAARISIGETAPGLEMAVITVRKGDKYVQVIAAVDGATHDQLNAVTSQLATLAAGRL